LLSKCNVCRYSAVYYSTDYVFDGEHEVGLYTLNQVDP
jgi:dTDP-4-dehydrorhamnose reductase